LDNKREKLRDSEGLNTLEDELEDSLDKTTIGLPRGNTPILSRNDNSILPRHDLNPTQCNNPLSSRNDLEYAPRDTSIMPRHDLNPTRSNNSKTPKNLKTQSSQNDFYVRPARVDKLISYLRSVHGEPKRWLECSIRAYHLKKYDKNGAVTLFCKGRACRPHFLWKPTQNFNPPSDSDYFSYLLKRSLNRVFNWSSSWGHWTKYHGL